MTLTLRGRKQKKADEMPPQTPGSIRVTLQDAVIGHLETAIRLWFDKQDPTSIHTLAVAAQGVLDATCRKKKIKRSELEADTKVRPKLHQDLLRGPQNFFKHGQHTQEFEDVVSLVPLHTRLIMMDCVSMYERIFGKVTLQMDAFAKEVLPEFQERISPEPQSR